MLDGMENMDRRKLIGSRIKARREYLDMTQATLGAAIGVSDSAVSNYERGERPILAEEIEEFARALRVPSRYLVGDTSEEEWLDEEAARFYRGVPSNLKPTARAMLKSLAAQDDREA